MAGVRGVWRSVATVGSAAVLAPVVGEWFVKLAEEQGAYEEPSSRLERAVSWLASLASLPGYQIVAGLVAGLTVGLWVDRLLRRREASASTPAVSPVLVTTVHVEDDPAELTRRLYLGRVQVRLRLVSDSAIGFYFIGLNNSAAPMTVRGVRGWVDYRDVSRGPSPSFVRLADPKFAEDYAREFAGGAEFTIVVYHVLPEGDADALSGLMVRDEARVAFAFRDLHIDIGWDGNGATERLPVWDEITCQVGDSMLLGLPTQTIQASGFRQAPPA